MKTMQLLRMTTFVTAMLLLCSCASTTPPPIEPADLTDTDGTKSDPAVAKCKRDYEAAKNQYERRAVLLQAIDDGVVYPGRPVSALDAILGTQAASALPIGKDAVETDYICLISKDLPTPPPNVGRVAAYGCIGWSIDFEYDDEGRIRSYYLHNLLKGHSYFNRDIPNPTHVSEVRRQYENASSQFERRAVCLKAIDEGALRASQPIEQVRELFGVEISELPTAKPANNPSRTDTLRIGKIDFASPTELANKNRPHGWFLVIEYQDDGTIISYYLSNVPTLRR